MFTFDVTQEAYSDYVEERKFETDYKSIMDRERVTKNHKCSVQYSINRHQPLQKKK